MDTICPRLLDLGQTMRNAVLWNRMSKMSFMQAAAGPSA